MSRAPALISFATTANQSMWSSGAAAEIDKTFDIIPQTTIGKSIDTSALGNAVHLTANASATFDLKATFHASAGSVSLKYPVNAYLDLPNAARPGESFTIGTKYYSTAAPDLKTTFPGIDLGLVLDASASLTGTLTTAFGAESFNFSPAFDVNKSLFSLSSSDLTHTFDAKKSFDIGDDPIREKLAGGAVTLTAALPNAFVTESRSVDPAPLGGFSTVTSTGTSNDILTVSADLVKVLALLDGIPPELASGDLVIGNKKIGEYSLASIVLSGGLKIAQKFTFQPTAIDVTVDPGFGADQIKTGHLGDSFTFTTPANWSGPVKVQTTYGLEGNLINDTGVVGHIDVRVTAGKFKLQAFYGDGTALKLDLGPIVDQSKNLFTGDPLYFANPGTGTFPNASFPFDSFNTVSANYSIPLATTPQQTIVPNTNTSFNGGFNGGDLGDPNNWSPQVDPAHPVLPSGNAHMTGGLWFGSITLNGMEFAGGDATLTGNLTAYVSSYISGNLTIAANGVLSTAAVVYLGGSITVQSNGTFSGGLSLADTGQAHFTQSGGTVNASVDIGLQAQSHGIYDLLDGPLAGTIWIGEHGTGTLNQSGGSSVSATIEIGRQFDGDGTYNLINGTVQSSELEVGKLGVGRFNQTGGTATIPDVLVGVDGLGTYDLHHGSLAVSTLSLGGDAGDGAVGTFNFNTNPGDDAILTLGQGHSFRADGQFIIGSLGTGIFNQGGGNIIAPGGLTLGLDYLTGDGPSQGTYELDGGSVTTPNTETIGSSGSGFFIQNGGSNSATSSTYSFNTLAQPYNVIGLVLGVSTNLSGYGSYTLNGGTLSIAVNETVGYGGRGEFTQTAGSNSTGLLVLGESGTDGGSYTMSGGTLTAAYEYLGYQSPGDFIQTGGSNTIGNGTVEGSGAALVLGANNISTGAEGTYQLGGSGALNVTGGVTVGLRAAHSAFWWNTETGDAATLAIDGPLTVGYYGKDAAFVQGAGQLSVLQLYLGVNFGSQGDYQLYGNPQTDSLTVAGSETIGGQGSGTFEQEGAANNADDVRIGQGAYYLDAGTLTTNTEEIGYVSFSALMQQIGGINTVSAVLRVGDALAFASGTYDLGGDGELDVGGAVIVDNGTFYFNREAGDDAIFTPGAHLVIVGENQFGTALFVQGGGTLETSVDIGQNAGAVGTFQFNDGNLIAGDPTLHNGSINVGDAGQGTLTQTGLLTQVSGTLDIGVKSASTGVFNLNAGVVTAEQEIIGDAGSGSLLQTSGKNNVSGNIQVGARSGATGLMSVLGGTVTGKQLSIGHLGANANVIVGSDSVVTMDSVLIQGGLLDVVGGATIGSGFGNGSVDVGTSQNDVPITATVHVGPAGSFLGFGTIGGNLVDDGSVEVKDGALVVTGAVTGNNAPIIDEGASLVIGGLEAGSIQFNGGNNTELKLLLPTEFTGLINGLAKGNIINLAHETVTAAVIESVSGTFQLDVSTTSTDHFTFTIDGDVLGTHFMVKDDGSGGSSLILAGAPTSSDFDDHGFASVLWRNADGTVATWQTDGGSIQPHFLPGVPIDWHIEGTGDFDGDGKADLLWVNDNGQVIAWLMANSSQFSSTPGLGTVPTNMHLAGIADVDGDGRSDLLWRDASTGAVLVQTMAGPQNTVSGVGPNWGLVGVGDFNGDGKEDVLFRNHDGGIVAYWQMAGVAVQTTIFLSGVPLDWHVAGTGDFDGNGVADIFWHNDNGANAVWLFARGGGIGSAAFFDGVGPEWHVAATGDFNGDGKDDVFWRADNGATAIWQMNGPNVPTVSFPGGVPNDWTPQVHHYDYV